MSAELSPGAGRDGVGAMADPVTTEVIRYGLEAAADLMRVNLCRTAVSPAIYESTDFGAALYDRDVRLVAQGKSMPGFMGVLGHAVKASVERAGGEESLREGDVLFTTYGYDIGAHQQDATVVVPGFFEGELVGYAVVKAHHADIAAKDPYCSDTTDIFQEGTIYPAIRIYEAGVRNEEIYRIILANSRAPETLVGDLNAQIGSARIGMREVNRLLERFGRKSFDLAVERILDHGELVMRDFLRTIPDGCYRASGGLDDNGLDADIVPIEVAVEVRGDEICVDLTESADQQRGPINCPRAGSEAAARIAVLLLAGITSANEGHFRAVAVKTRPGSIFDPISPAPIFLYGLPAQPAVSLVQEALAHLLPGSVPASDGGHGAVFFWGFDDGEFWINIATQSVGMGASARGDMTTPLMTPVVSGLKTPPTEMLELDGHVLIERVRLAADSGGTGRFRGGLGVETHFRARGEQFLITIMDQTRFPPRGLHGGEDARPNTIRLRYLDGTVSQIAKVTSLPIPAGTVIEHHTAGGGGWGPASERDPEAVRHDVREGYVTEAAARRDYPHAFGR